MENKQSKFSDTKAFKLLQKYWLYLVIVIAGIIVAFSSVNMYKEEVLEIDPDIKYEERTDLCFASAGFDTLNPIISNSEDTYYISKLIYSSLFDYTEDMNVEGDLTESYSVDTDRAYVDIKLKSGIKWHDGSDLTADDVRFTVNAIKAYGSKGIYYKNASKIYSVNVKSNSELRIYFRNNYDCSLDDLTFPILPSDKHSSSESLISDKDNFKPVGTGQYVFESYDYLKGLKLNPNKNFYGSVAQNTIDVKILPGKKWSSNMMEINAVTCYIDKGSDRKSLVSDKNLTMYDMVSNDVDFLVFNTSSGRIFANKEMRRGACYSIDSEEVLRDGYMGDGVLSDTIYYPGFLEGSEAKQNSGYGFDRDKGREAFAAAGYEDRNMNGNMENEEGDEVAITILYNKNNANRIAAAKIIKKNLENVGFTATTSGVSQKEYEERIKKKDFDILITGYEMEASYDLRDFFNGKNPWKYNNSKMYNQARKLDRLYTAEEYAENFAVLKSMLVEETPYYPLCYKKMGLIGLETFNAGKLPVFNDIYKNCSTWSWKKVVSEE